MAFKQRISKFFSKKSKLNFASDIVFVLFIIALLIPASRFEIIAFVNKVRVAVWNPSINEKGTIGRLAETDYQMVLQGLDGEQYQFSEAKGKVIFINIWATWCPPCVAEMPTIQELYDKYQNSDQIVFLIISNEETGKVTDFIKRKGYTFPVYINHYRLPEAFQTTSIPTTFLVSKSGEIIIRQVGAAKWSGDKMMGIMERLIND